MIKKYFFYFVQYYIYIYQYQTVVQIPLHLLQKHVNLIYTKCLFLSLSSLYWYIQAHIYISVQILAHTHIYIYRNTCINMFICMHIYTYIYMYIYIQIIMKMPSIYHICTYINSKHTFINTYYRDLCAYILSTDIYIYIDIHYTDLNYTYTHIIYIIHMHS